MAASARHWAGHGAGPLRSEPARTPRARVRGRARLVIRPGRCCPGATTMAECATLAEARDRPTNARALADVRPARHPAQVPSGLAMARGSTQPRTSAGDSEGGRQCAFARTRLCHWPLRLPGTTLLHHASTTRISSSVRPSRPGSSVSHKTETGDLKFCNRSARPSLRSRRGGAVGPWINIKLHCRHVHSALSV